MWREPGGETTGDVARCSGDVARSKPFDIGGWAEPGVPGNGGKGMEGGGAGRAVWTPDFLAEVCEPDRASAIAAASGESESRLKFTAEKVEAPDARLSAAICCYRTRQYGGTLASQ